MALATLDAAAARHRSIRSAGSEDAFWDNLVPMENGVPVIMKGYHPPGPSFPEGTQPRRRAGRSRVHPARQQHLHPAAQSVALFRQQPAGRGADPAGARAPYQPPITASAIGLNSAIQAYPLQKGIGNNPTDQQMFIRQRINQ